jgi:hypothetical protein
METTTTTKTPSSHPKHARQQAKKHARKRNAAAKTHAKTASASPERWSQHVTETSDAMTLEPEVFRDTNPERIALSVKRSAERSRRRKTTPYASAMSMLTFYLNRAGKNLSPSRRAVIGRAKTALRRLFGRA